MLDSNTRQPDPEYADPEYAAQLRFGAYDSEKGEHYKLRIGTDPSTDPSNNPDKYLDAALLAMGSYAESPELSDTYEPKEIEGINQGLLFRIGLNASGEAGASDMGLYSREHVTKALERAVGTVALNKYMEDMEKMKQAIDESHDSSSVNAVVDPAISSLDNNTSPSALEFGSTNAPTDTEPVEERMERCLADIRDKYNFKEECSAESVLKELEDNLSQFNALLIAYSSQNVKDIVGSAVRSITDTFNSRGTVYFTGRPRKNVEEILFSRVFGDILNKFKAKTNTHLSKRAGVCLGELSTQFGHAQRFFQEATNRGPNFLELELAEKLRGQLIKIVNTEGLIQTEHRLLEEDINNLRRALGAPNPEGEGELEPSKFRNEEVEKWASAAAELKDAGIDDSRLEKLIDDIKSRVNIELGMVDDPNSPRVWFGDRIINDSNKQRQGITISGRPKDITTSHQVVAELVADMLRNPDTWQKSGDIIQCDPTGEVVELGQHRAAALAIIYGDKWKEEAGMYGITVQNRK